MAFKKKKKNHIRRYKSLFQDLWHEENKYPYLVSATQFNGTRQLMTKAVQAALSLGFIRKSNFDEKKYQSQLCKKESLNTNEKLTPGFWK